MMLGIMGLSIMMFSITTLSIMMRGMTHTIMMLGIHSTQRHSTFSIMTHVIMTLS